MDVTVIPQELNIHESKSSKTVITISNNRPRQTEIGVVHSESFRVFPRLKILAPLEKCEFTVEYHPSRHSDHFVNFTLWDPVRNAIRKKLKVEINIEKDPKSESSDSLACQICLQLYNEKEQAPRMLCCGHTICTECADKFWKEGNQQKILCPFDRTPTVLTDVNSLVKNFLVLEIVESRSKKMLEKSEKPENSNIISDTPCAENQYHDATVFCSTCEVDLCENCYDDTHKSKIFINHKKIPLAEKPVQLPKCSVHPYNTAEFKCKLDSCSAPSRIFCHTCLLREHKDHPYQHLLEIITSNQEKLQDIIQKINIRQQKLQHKIQVTNNCISSYEPSDFAYQNKYQSIIEQFELKKARAIAKFESITDKEKQRYQERQEELQHDLQMTTEVSQEMDRILKSKTNLFSVDELAERAIALCAVQTDDQEKFLSLDKIQTGLNEKMELIMKS